LGQGRELLSHQAAWAAKRFNAGQRLFLEPWVHSLGEAGLQFDVPKRGAGDPCLIGVAPLLTDATGAYRGSRFDPLASVALDWSQAEDAGLVAAKRAQSLGYFGPFGIDAMWYRNRDGSPGLRPLQDINARWTMGRLSLGFRSLLTAGDVGAWVHLRSSAKTLDDARAWWQQLKTGLPSEVQLRRTSPLTLGGKAVRHATALLLARDEKPLRLAVEYAIALR
jgi:hypothetical protein